jgi:hypothetical protein
MGLLGFGRHSQAIRHALHHVGATQQGAGNHTMMSKGSARRDGAAF